MNATVTYVSPLLDFPRNNMKAELMDSEPSGSIAACHKAGWIHKERFTQWFKHFFRSLKLFNKYSIILMLDGHYYHSSNIEVIDCAQETGCTFFTFPHIALII
jgi:hypothetical protein